jgi:hypothetical protein
VAVAGLSRWPKPPSGCGSRTGAAFRWVRTLLGRRRRSSLRAGPKGRFGCRGALASPHQTWVGRVRRSLVLSPQRLGGFPTEANDLLLELSEPLPGPLDQTLAPLDMTPSSDTAAGARAGSSNSVLARWHVGFVCGGVVSVMTCAASQTEIPARGHVLTTHGYVETVRGRPASSQKWLVQTVARAPRGGSVAHSPYVVSHGSGRIATLLG